MIESSVDCQKSKGCFCGGDGGAWPCCCVYAGREGALLSQRGVERCGGQCSTLHPTTQACTLSQHARFFERTQTETTDTTFSLDPSCLHSLLCGPLPSPPLLASPPRHPHLTLPISCSLRIIHLARRAPSTLKCVFTLRVSHSGG